MISLGLHDLEDFIGDLRRLDSVREWDQDLQQAHAQAGKLVVEAAQRKAFDPMARKAAGTLQAKGSTIIGGRGVPFFGGAEFGAGQGVLRSRSTGNYLGYNQFQPFRGQEGYFLYPAIRATREEVIDLYGDAVEQITSGAFPD